MITPLVMGNWKMAIDLDGVVSFKAMWSSKRLLKGVEVAIAPPAPYLALMTDLPNVSLAGQDASTQLIGARTGDVSAKMLSDFTCRYVIVGHSERRQNYAEANEQIAEKARQVQALGMTPVVCVGESASEREAGLAEDFVTRQVIDSCVGLTSDLVIAYEPVWAIGSGEAASPEIASAMHGRIKAALAKSLGDIRVLYGGSVSMTNCASFSKAPEVDGLLVGGASLEAESFWQICASVGESS